MKFIHKNMLELGAFAIILFGYFVTRITYIMQLPIFTDEAIYTRWAQIAYNDAAWRFISLTDGKQPSFVWFQMVLLRFFEDPLLAGRMVSVFSGAITLIGIFFLTQLIFKNLKISLLAASIYLIYPFALIYDRLGLYESLVAAFFVWAIYFQLTLVKKLRLDIAMILGFILGGGILTKSSGFLIIYLIPFLYLLLDFKKKTFKKNAIKLTVLLSVSVLIAIAMYSVLRLSPFFHIIEEKNTIFVYTISNWLALTNQIKIENFISNANGLISWFVNYFSIPFIVAVIFSFFFKSHYKEKIILLLWFLLPALALFVFGKTLYPRFLFFMTLPLLPLVAFGAFSILNKIKSRIALIFIIIAFLAYPLYANYFILTDFKNAPIPIIDLEQFVNGWPAGGGVRESIEFFENEAKNKKIIIATQGTFGLMPFAYEIFLGNNPNIEVRGYWPIEDTVPGDVLAEVKEKDVYFVFYQPCPSCNFPGAAPVTWPLEKISEYEKGAGEVTLTVYKVLPR